MKRLTLPLIVAALAAIACGASDEQQIRKTAQGYLEATGNYRIDEAAPYAVPEMQRDLFPFMKAMMSRVDTNYILSNTPATIEITGVNINDDTSATIGYVKTTPIKQESESLCLVKRNGKWLVKVIANIPPAVRLYAQGNDTIRIDADAARKHFADSLTISK
ncbi:MAG: hypothetical protein SPJ13_03370 [Bacteroidales bacterium]|nr:hypothetical protein [Bacteroidales bacterium]